MDCAGGSVRPLLCQAEQLMDGISGIPENSSADSHEKQDPGGMEGRLLICTEGCSTWTEFKAG